jgi:cellulose synthase/poly-beta-1,6-N-acetylglucosamine synthase-like glycosyltransferase
MIFIWVLVCSVSLFYSLLILFFYLGWIKVNIFKNKKNEQTNFVSIIIAARNEEKNILNLLQALSIQTYKHFEVIIVDDHSTDKTTELIKENNFIKCNLVTLNSIKKGKKAAIAVAIPMSTGELILATDADCIPNKNWVECMVNFYNSETVDFIIGPVKQTNSKNFFKQLFSLDFLSLQAVGAGAAEMKTPFICNGANLAFSRKVWENISKVNGNQFASGDDVFLLHNAINILPKNKIKFVFSEDAIVFTPPPADIKAFFNQRIRWASKAKGYKNSTSLVTSIAVILINCLLLGLLIASIFNPQIIYFFFITLITKSIVDLAILLSAASFYKQKKILLFFIPLQLLYFIYTTGILLFSLFGKYKWKERDCK